jgi:L-rhamnose mutarotase
MRVALHSVIVEGKEAGYEEAHLRIPDDLVVSFARVGIRDWTIWRSGRHLFHLVDCDDFAKAMRLLEDDPANRRWQDFIGPYVDRFETTNGRVADGAADMVLHEVWTLTEQEAAPR